MRYNLVGMPHAHTRHTPQKRYSSNAVIQLLAMKWGLTLRGLLKEKPQYVAQLLGVDEYNSPLFVAKNKSTAAAKCYYMVFYMYPRGFLQVVSFCSSCRWVRVRARAANGQHRCSLNVSSRHHARNKADSRQGCTFTACRCTAKKTKMADATHRGAVWGVGHRRLQFARKDDEDDF